MFTKKQINRLFVFLLMLGLISSLSLQAFAVEKDPNSKEDVFKMSLEELMEVPVVFSASRQAQKMGELSVPVSVITHEDIHYSGLTNIPEILQFTPGIDMLRFNRYSYSVGVRGLHDVSSDRTLVLVNGRSAESSFFGGTSYRVLPVFMEDIERIEVVRGPGGAAWGANAFNGVINIITKKPEDVLGGFVSTTITEFGDSYTHLRYAEKKDKWKWRVSAGYEDLKSSEDAGAGRYKSNTTATVNRLMGFSSFTAANDFMRNSRFDSEAFYDYSDQTRISFGTGYSRDIVGDWEYGGYYPRGNGYDETVRSYAKIEHDFDNGSSGYLQWSGNFGNTNLPSMMKWFSMQNEIEGQFNFKVGSRHDVSVGGNLRFIRLDTQLLNPRQFSYAGEPYDEVLAEAFLIDRWTLSDRLTLENQIRIERYSSTQTDWSGRMTALYAMDEEKDHMLRFSFAKSFRTPFTSLRETETHRVLYYPSPPYPVGKYAFNVVPSYELENEEIYSLEAGYTGKLAKNLTFRADTYYQRYEKLIAYTKIYDSYKIPTNKAKNIDGAKAYGAELELILEGKAGRLSVWYAYNGFESDISQQALRSYMPAQQKMGVTGRLFLPDGWTFNTNYRYTGSTLASDLDTTLADVEPSSRLDLTISKKFAKGNGEFMIGISDVLNKTNGPNFASGHLTAHETPGRTFFTRVQWQF